MRKFRANISAYASLGASSWFFYRFQLGTANLPLCRIHPDRIHPDRFHLDRIHLDRIHPDRIHLDHIHLDRIHLGRFRRKRKSSRLQIGRFDS